MATPHISAEKHEIAKTVLMAGDPLRAELWANKYLSNIKKVNNVRNMYAFTGFIEEKKVTVMGHGMGMESIGIYAFELYKFYDVDTIIRFGSGGLYSNDYKLQDVFICDKAWTDSNYGDGFGFEIKTLDASQDIVDLAKKIADKNPNENHDVYIATAHSSPWFYAPARKLNYEDLVKDNILIVEMEAYALYAIAQTLNKKALTILTASDSLISHEGLSSIDRQTSFNYMFDICAEIVKEL